MALLTTFKRTVWIIVLLVGLFMMGCGEGESAAPTPEDAAVTADFGNVVSASGKVMPVQWATMSFEAGGRVTELVAEGSQVTAGDVLARLDATDLRHAVDQARAALATAEAELAQAQAGARPEDIASAQGAVMVAQGNVAAAEGALTQAETGTGFAVDAAEAELAQAQGRLASARAELARASAELARLQAGPRPEEVAMYQALVNQAQSDFLYFENLHFDQFVDNDVGGGPEERARYQRESARGARDAAQAQLDLIESGATEQEIASARAGVSAAQGQVAIAEAGVTAAEVALAKAQAATSDVTIAEAQVQIAEGQLVQAQAQQDRLEAGATSEELGILAARVDQAEAALDQAEAALAKATIEAPFAGTVGTVYLKEGESVVPGTPVLVLGDVSHLRVETTDLNEVDATQVDVGDPVTLTFDALPGEAFDGELVRVAPMASAGQGGTNFTAVIETLSSTDALRWGMTAFVDIEVD